MHSAEDDKSYQKSAGLTTKADVAYLNTLSFAPIAPEEGM